MRLPSFLLSPPAHHQWSFRRCTKGIGITQPAAWQDAGAALDHPGLRGCHMPKGPGKDFKDPQTYLQYNEVRPLCSMHSPLYFSALTGLRAVHCI